MYIQSLEIHNFQKHTNLKVEFSDKLNVIYGESDAGKSCIIRALKWVLFNEPKGNVIRKEDTKKTSAKVTLDNGVMIEKIKSNSINAYILYKDGEEKRFDSVGKTIPDEIKKALQVSTISVDKEDVILNIAYQISLPFLIGKSATFRSKLFNKLTGSDIIDKVFQSLNKDILKTGREAKLETEHLKEQQKALEDITIQKDKLEKLYNNFKNKFDNLKVLQARYENANNLKDKLEGNCCDLQETNALLSNIKTVPDDLVIGLKKDIDKLENYELLINKIKEINVTLKHTNDQLNDLKTPKININKLKNDYDKLTKSKDLFSQLLGIKGDIIDSDSKIYQYKNLIIENEKKYKEILKEIKICPFFKKPCPLNKEPNV